MVGKLIRNGIAERIVSKGESVPITVLGDADYRQSLFAKMREEVQEIVVSDGCDVQEYGDLLQVMMDLAAFCGISWDAVETSRIDKKNRLGGFDARKFAVLVEKYQESGNE